MLSEDEVRSRLELLGHLLEKVIAVNSFFITAGYGVFFGVWAIARDKLGHGAQVTACLLLLVSAAIFIGWHLIGLVSMNLTIASIGRDPPEGYGARALRELRIKSAAFVERYGLVVTLTAAALGALAVLVLGVGMVRSL